MKVFGNMTHSEWQFLLKVSQSHKNYLQIKSDPWIDFKISYIHKNLDISPGTWKNIECWKGASQGQKGSTIINDFEKFR